MFSKAKETPAAQLFPLEAFVKVAEWYLNHLLMTIPAINVGGFHKDAWGIGKKVTEAQKQKFIAELSQTLFDEIKAIPLIEGISPTIPMTISEPLIIKVAKEVGLPEVCIPKEKLLKPVAWFSPEGKILVDNGKKQSELYDVKNVTSSFVMGM